MSKRFITLEGGDGSGKTTQIELLKTYLENKGYEVVLAREPGGTEISEKIRQIILDIANDKMSDMTELLLYASARAQLVSELIAPALEAGKVVICDRFVDSSAVYQGIARGLGVDLVYQVNAFALQGLMPEVTFYLDLSPEEGIKRKKKQATLDRMESEKQAFHEKVVEGYRQLAKEQAERIVTIDATLPIEEIHKKIIEKVDDTLS